jgi:hypothetical protein
MSVLPDSGFEFRAKPPHRPSRSAVLPDNQKSTAGAPRRGAPAFNHASACQKEFALEQALRKTETPERPFIRNG